MNKADKKLLALSFKLTYDHSLWFAWLVLTVSTLICYYTHLSMLFVLMIAIMAGIRAVLAVCYEYLYLKRAIACFPPEVIESALDLIAYNAKLKALQKQIDKLP